MVSRQETGTARPPFQDLIEKRGRLSSGTQEVIGSAQQEYQNLLVTFNLPSLQEGLGISPFASAYLENRLVWKLAKHILSASILSGPQTRGLENPTEGELNVYFAARGNAIAEHVGLDTLPSEQNANLRTPLEELAAIISAQYILTRGLEKRGNILNIGAFDSTRYNCELRTAEYILAEGEFLSPEKRALNGVTIPDILSTPLVNVPGIFPWKKVLLRTMTAAVLAVIMAKDTLHQPPPTATSNPGIKAGATEQVSKEPKQQLLTTTYIDIAEWWLSEPTYAEEPAFRDWMDDHGYDVTPLSRFGPTPHSSKAGSIGWIVRRHPTDDPKAPQREVPPRVNQGHRAHWISEVYTTNRKTGLTQKFGLLWPPEILEIPKTQMSQAENANALKLNAVEMNGNIVYVYPRYVLLAEKPENTDWRWFIEPEDNTPSDVYRVWPDGAIEWVKDGGVGPSLLDQQRASGDKK